MYRISLASLEGTPLAAQRETLRAITDAALARSHGDEAQWRKAVEQLPAIEVERMFLDRPAIGMRAGSTISQRQRSELVRSLKQLHPWRKGPFDLFSVIIDSEWRCDRKWDRLHPHLQALHGRVVLDVGCGNGYYGWRMLGQGARLVLGIDPALRYLYQFAAVNRYLKDNRMLLLPVTSEQLPKNLGCFDTVFSMGVLYHRRSPTDHLQELKSFLKPGGELVLETLVVTGDSRRLLVPSGRYAKMRNVWSLPSSEALLRWLAEAGFTDARLVDESRTTPAEQRSTPWMTFQSLQDFLDPDHFDLTVEGHPAPRRAILLATRNE